MKNVLRFLALPSTITTFERKYLARVNRIALWFFALHVPALALIAALNGTGAITAAALTSGILVGPLTAHFVVRNPRVESMVLGVTAMFMGGLLVHFGQGPMQIEMHFYFFSLIAMCAVFGNPLVIVSAAVTVALHHLMVWLVLPRSVFNYDASAWVVAVHAAFVVLESVAACFISRSFFDNVIGLERIVQLRTAARDAKNGEMRLLLDHLQEGVLTIDRQGRIVGERSAALSRWFTIAGDATSWLDVLSSLSPPFAERTRLAFTEVIEDVMPIELTLEQMPHRLRRGDTHLHVEYRPIGERAPHDQFLVIVSDVTAEVAQKEAEQSNREAMALFARFFADRSGFESFFAESARMIDVLARGAVSDGGAVRRLIHTLKGNASIFGLHSVAGLCHALEDAMAETGSLPTRAAYTPLMERWLGLEADRRKLFGGQPHTRELDDASYSALLSAVATGESPPLLLRRLVDLDREPTARRLAGFGEQARRIGERLEKQLSVVIEDHGVRLDARRWAHFWSRCVHPIRNAIDHGIEPAADRLTAGKPAHGTLTLRTWVEGERIVVEIADDGRGIDWPAIEERARRAGLPCHTTEELQRALFADGISTASAVTDLSGRGLGMSALREGVEALDGVITIDSSPAGTTLRMTFPLASAEADALATAA